MCTPKRSQERLLNEIRQNGPMPFAKLLAFEENEDVYFGSGVTVLDIILDNRDRGLLKLDISNKTVSFRA